MSVNLCGLCKRSLQEFDQNVVTTKECNHTFHENCLVNVEGHHAKAEEGQIKLFCPFQGCAKELLRCEPKNLKEKVLEVITEAVKKPKTSLKRFKVAVYLAVASLIAVVVALQFSWPLLAVAVIGLPLSCRYISKKMDQFFLIGGPLLKKT